MKALREWKGADDGMRRFLVKCREAVRAVEPGAEVILFGSRARGEAGPESDYDLLVLTEGDTAAQLRRRIRQVLYDVALDHDVVVSTFVYSRRRWDGSPWRAAPLHAEVEEDGIVL